MQAIGGAATGLTPQGQRVAQRNHLAAYGRFDFTPRGLACDRLYTTRLLGDFSTRIGR